MSADRNLLFGILALQMDFISRDALIQAMHAWVLKKSVPLGQILVDQGVLTAEHHALLESLVRAHLKQHGDDPRQSLAALPALGAVNPGLRQVTDGDLQASLDHVSTATLHEDPHATRPLSVGTPTSTGLRFQVLRPHARGGLGEVFLALDTELRREVALKQIRDPYADHPESQSRFLREAEITGGLEHPGIVPVYGLGRYDDGRPYYAMRFIHGESLQDAIDRFHKAETPRRDPGERALALRELLGRFVAMCHAVAYAHSRGVLHRDLKPANVMLGPYGETLVVDWGLAKPGGPAPVAAPVKDDLLSPTIVGGATPTHGGAVLGTPAYMSPEQAAGRVADMGPASDVYSLGAVLYCLLTGKPPYQGADLNLILEQVRRGLVAPPRQVKRTVPRALEAICLRALATEPEARYTSADGLARDVQRWLADEPVHAYREPWSARLWRAARRHRQLVTGAAALLVTALVALSASRVLIGQEKARTEAARAQAVANFRKARDVVNRFYVQLTKDYLLNEPGMQPLRKELAQQALAFHQDFVAQQGNDPDIQADLGKSLLVLADITNDTGTKARAIEFVQRAIALFDQLAHDHPDVAEHRRESALCRNKLGAFYNSAHERANAEGAFRQAQERFQQLVNAAPQDRDDRNGLGLASNNLGVLLVAMGNFAEAAENLGKAMQIREGLAHEDPESTDYQRNLADSYNGRAQVAFGTRHPEQAVQDLEEARRIRQQLAAKHPEVIEFDNDLAGACNNLALVYRKMGKREEALRTYQEALDIRSRVADRNPTVTQFQRDLANVYHNWGNLYLADLEIADNAAAVQRAYGPGLEKYRKALEISQKLANDHPQVLQFQIDVGMACCSLGNFVYYVRKGDAVPWYDQAIAILAKVPEEDRSPEVGQGLGESYWGRAGALSEAGNPTLAWTEWKLALQHDHGPSAGALRNEAEEWANQVSTLPAWPVLGSAVVGLVGTAGGQGPLLAACRVLPGRAGEPFLSGEVPYGLAVVYAQLAAAVLRDEDLPPAERHQRASTYKARAIALLRRAMATGYFHARDRRVQLLKEPSLEPLRSLPELQDLLDP